MKKYIKKISIGSIVKLGLLTRRHLQFQPISSPKYCPRGSHVEFSISAKTLLGKRLSNKHSRQVVSWWPSWNCNRQTIHKFSKEPPNNHSYNIIIQLTVHFLTRRFYKFNQSEHIMGPGSHFEFPISTKNKHLVYDHPINISAKFGSNLFSGFR
jgi:hypothetical protein